MKSLKVFIGIVLIVIVIISAYLYLYFGFKYVIEALSYISYLPIAEQRDIYSNISVINNNYVGLLANINLRKNKINGIWVWTTKGLRYFNSDKNTIFSDFRTCEDQKWKTSNSRVYKDSNIGSGEWLRNTKEGDYVEINFEHIGKSDLKIQEITSYDWWVFIPGLPSEYFNQTCQNR